jgi:glycogen debranching enzyme
MRDFHELTRQHTGISQEASSYGTTVMVSSGEDSKAKLHLVSNAAYVPASDWYYNFEYTVEMERGYDYHEDCFHPGYFEMELLQGHNEIFVVASAEKRTNVSLASEPRRKVLKINAFHDRQGLDNPDILHSKLLWLPTFSCQRIQPQSILLLQVILGFLTGEETL